MDKKMIEIIKMNKDTLYMFLCFSFLLLLFHNSCLSPFREDLGEVTLTGDMIDGTGTVKYLSFEGGFYGIVTDNNKFKNLDPINLPLEFRKDGLRVRFKAKIRYDAASFHMWGIIVELLYIRKI